MLWGPLHNEAGLVRVHQAVILRVVHFSVCILHVSEIVCFLKVLLWKRALAPEWEVRRPGTGREVMPARGRTQKRTVTILQGPHLASLQKRDSGKQRKLPTWASPPGTVRAQSSSRVHHLSCEEGTTDPTVSRTPGFRGGQLYGSLARLWCLVTGSNTSLGVTGKVLFRDE